MDCHVRPWIGLTDSKFFPTAGVFMVWAFEGSGDDIYENPTYPHIFSHGLAHWILTKTFR